MPCDNPNTQASAELCAWQPVHCLLLLVAAGSLTLHTSTAKLLLAMCASQKRCWCESLSRGPFTSTHLARRSDSRHSSRSGRPPAAQRMHLAHKAHHDYLIV
eukprot:GHRQ01030614.1.p1 GENE.GHRQ01030614.1~~GHRQ01030614.1.p1  ORF type:complete len:102 (-),score=19.83 GHRQ01030614.1:53-358(-)